MSIAYRAHLIDVSAEEFRDKSGWQVMFKISHPHGSEINYWPRVILPETFISEAEGLKVGQRHAEKLIDEAISKAS